jgi:gamma-glutamyl-gamma-aminobutyrate hydrolase PuuD
VSVVVGIACNPRNVSSSRGKVPAETVARSYVDAVRLAGGMPLLLPVLAAGDVAALLDTVDRVLVIGGGDVDPSFYDELPVPESGEPNTERDAFEIALVRGAVSGAVRTLAICRGMQVANVALGGSLVQHVEGHGGDVRHNVRVEVASALSGVVGATALDANSQHHQAVARVGEGLRPVAWADDGTVEGVESGDAPLLGVQWHPELLTDEPEHRALFQWLVG